MKIALGVGITVSMIASVLVTATGQAVPRARQGHQADRNAQAPCAHRSAKTLAGNSDIRIYSLGGRGATVFACIRPAGPQVRLGPRHADGWGAALRGPFAIGAPWAGGVEVRQTGLDTDKVYSVARNVRSGRAIHCLIGASGLAGRLPRFARVALSRSGVLAWSDVMPGGSAGGQIGVCELHGRVRVLDQGAGVVLRSLRLHGSTLTWQDSRGTQSAQI
jgi:hypothetical protein